MVEILLFTLCDVKELDKKQMQIYNLVKTKEIFVCKLNPEALKQKEVRIKIGKIDAKYKYEDKKIGLLTVNNNNIVGLIYFKDQVYYVRSVGGGYHLITVQTKGG